MPQSPSLYVVFSSSRSPFLSAASAIEYACAATRVSLLTLIQHIQYVVGYRIFVRRTLPALLEILYPVLGPRPAVVVHIVRVVGGKLGRPAVPVLDVAQALDICISHGRRV